MAQMLIPADAIAQEALRYLHLLQHQHLLQQQQLYPGRRLVLVLDRLPTPGQVRLHYPRALSRCLTTPFSDTHLAQLSREDFGGWRTRRALQFRRAKIIVHFVCIFRAVPGVLSRSSLCGRILTA
jgi:hypothetical protein